MEALDEILSALANPHRRDIVYTLGLHPCTINQLAAMRELSLPGIHKHITILEQSHLVSRRKVGRSNVLTLNRHTLAALQVWLAQFHPGWGSDDATLSNYAAYVESDGLTTSHPQESP